MFLLLSVYIFSSLYMYVIYVEEIQPPQFLCLSHFHSCQISFLSNNVISYSYMFLMSDFIRISHISMDGDKMYFLSCELN